MEPRTDTRLKPTKGGVEEGMDGERKDEETQQRSMEWKGVVWHKKNQGR